MSCSLRKVFIASLLLFLTGSIGLGTLGQPSFQFPGTYNYLLNKPPNDALLFTPDRNIGITYTHVSSSVNGGQLTTFDVATGTTLDSEFAGFGPLDFELVQLSDGFRVVALTSRGGPRTVTIYDLSATGILTFRAERQLTTSGSDEGSNLILSSRARAGFIRVAGIQSLSEVVSFSLDTGEILNRASLPRSDYLNVHDSPARALLVTGRNQSLLFYDVTNPSQFTPLGEAVLPSTGIGNGTQDIYTVFSGDGSIVFAGGESARLTAVDTNTRQILGSLAANYWSLRLKIFESGGTRWIGIRGGNEELSFFRGIVVVDATNPASMNVVNQLSLGNSNFFQRRDFAFSRNGKRLVLASDTGAFAYRLPEMIEKLNVPLLTLIGFTIGTALEPERILGAWGSNNNFSATVYSIPLKQNSIATFDLDGRTDLAVFRPSSSTWHWLRSIDGTTASTGPLGESGDLLAPGDYDGDEITDAAVFRPNVGQWLIRHSSSGNVETVNFGIGSDIPVPADYDGDGKSDLAVFRRYSNRWLIVRSSDGQFESRKGPFGRVRPVIGDYDGDRKVDFAAFRDGTWTIHFSSGAPTLTASFGSAGDIPVSGDFDNDGKADLATYTPATRTWRIQRSLAGFLQVVFGETGDVIVPADYDADGKTDIATYRPSNSTFNIQWSSFSGPPTIQFGNAGDVPIAAQR